MNQEGNLDEPGEPGSSRCLVHVRGRELVDEPGGKSEQLEDRSVGRCATTTGRCGRGKEESWRKSFSEEGLSDCVLKTWDNIL